MWETTISMWTRTDAEARSVSMCFEVFRCRLSMVFVGFLAVSGILYMLDVGWAATRSGVQAMNDPNPGQRRRAVFKANLMILLEGISMIFNIQILHTNCTRHRYASVLSYLP